MADVSKFKLGATTYNIKDANALHLSGGTLTGVLNFANNVYNTVGNDVQIGDANQAGKLAIKGKNGNTGIYFAPYSGSTAQTITINGSGQMDISGTLNVATAIKQNGVAVSLSNHTHATSIAASTGTSALTMSHGGKYALTAGGTSFIFTLPADSNTDTKVTQTATTNSANYEVLFSVTADNTTRTEGARKSANLLFNPSTGNLTFGNGTTAQLISKTPSRTAAFLTVGGSKKTAGTADGTAVRLGAGGVTIVGSGEYADNRYNVADLDDGTESLYMGSDGAAYIETNGQTIANRKTFTFGSDGTFNSPSTIKQNGTAVSLSNHTHTASLATDTGTSAITLAYGGKYKLTAGGQSVIFTMPASDNTNTTYTLTKKTSSVAGATSVADTSRTNKVGSTDYCLTIAANATNILNSNTTLTPA